jgi:hypothetical protein
VPVSENTAILAERYTSLGGKINVIIKDGVGHHPHSLDDPEPIVNFITSFLISCHYLLKFVAAKVSFFIGN